MYTTIQPTQQLQLPIGVKEEILPQARKRVAIVSVKLVKEASLYYANRTIRNPRDGQLKERPYDMSHPVTLGTQ
ncbi:hypothetical protein [Metalysinibacillus jejuensis]|uniref:hypothetical protein n=1 Tax=Metalysinibacillus jejuensis TaxID=914327 RepID=UPI0031F348BB